VGYREEPKPSVKGVLCGVPTLNCTRLSRSLRRRDSLQDCSTPVEGMQSGQAVEAHHRERPRQGIKVSDHQELVVYDRLLHAQRPRSGAPLDDVHACWKLLSPGQDDVATEMCECRMYCPLATRSRYWKGRAHGQSVSEGQVKAPVLVPA